MCSFYLKNSYINIYLEIMNKIIENHIYWNERIIIKKSQLKECLIEAKRLGYSEYNIVVESWYYYWYRVYLGTRAQRRQDEILSKDGMRPIRILNKSRNLVNELNIY